MSRAFEPLGLGDEALELTRRLIRIDTSNPPGNETPAAELLAEYLREAGAECELAGPDPGRLNLVARVRGGDGPSLLLMAHTDVVPAPAEGWTVDPFAGTVREGRIVGRGAADMKGELGARAVALAAIARSGERPPGDVVLVAESDEERNTADVGLSWLVRRRPELLRTDFAINEGGGELLELADGRRVVTVSIGEKRVTSARIRIHGRAGHASVPGGAENPLAHLATAIEALASAPAPIRIDETLDLALRALGAAGGEPEERIERAARQHPSLLHKLPAMARLTVTPTGVASHEPANVIPPYADLICDCRVLPGEDEDAIRDHVERALGDRFRWELDLLEPLEGGTASPADTELFSVIADYVAQRLPGAEALPLVSTGFTDSHWVRSALGTAAYGFAPVLNMDLGEYHAGVHGADESLELADLTEMAEFHAHAALALGARR